MKTISPEQKFMMMAKIHYNNPYLRENRDWSAISWCAAHIGKLTDIVDKQQKRIARLERKIK